MNPPAVDARLAPSVVAVPPFVPAAVVFDLDGLLVDSEDVWGEAERQVVEALGHAWDPSVRALLFGKGPEDAARTLAEHLGGHDVEEIDALMLDAALAGFRGGIVPRPGAAALVRDLQRAVPLAVATNSRRMLAELALTSAGIGDAFDAVVCAEDVAEPKPAPDAYETACGRLRADPRRSVALEDSPIGVAAAKAAGLWVLGCSSFPGQALPEADAEAASLVEVDAGAWLAVTSADGAAAPAPRQRTSLDGSRGSRDRPM